MALHVISLDNEVFFNKRCEKTFNHDTKAMTILLIIHEGKVIVNNAARIIKRIFYIYN